MSRFLIVLLAALLLAIMVRALALIYVELPHAGSGASPADAGYLVLWISNGCFVLALALIVWLRREVQVANVRALAAVAAFILLNLLSFWIGEVLVGQGVFLGTLLYMPVWAIGFHPDGADAGLVAGSAIWGVSMLVPVAIGSLAGLALRMLGHERPADLPAGESI